MRRIITLSLLCLVSIPTMSQTMTLEECQQSARENFPMIKQLSLLDKSLEFNISNANKAYLPQVSITAIEGYIFSGLPSFAPGGSSESGFKFIGIGQINQTIWDGGATKAQKNILQASNEVDKSTIEVTAYAVRDRVNQLYFGVLLIEEQLRQLDLLRQNLERNLSKVKQSADQGLAYTSDADEVKVEMLKIDQRKDEFTYARRSYLLMLSLMTGKNVSQEQTLTRPAAPVGGAEIRRPELTLYQSQRMLAEQQDKLSKVGYMPKVGLLALGVRLEPGASMGLNTLSSLSLAGINLSWNTAGLYRNKNNKALTKVTVDRIQNQQETFLWNTNIDLSRKRLDIEKQVSILSKDQEIIALRSSIKKAYELKYQNGVCTVQDLVVAVNAESEAISNKAMHEIQLLLSQYEQSHFSGN